MRLPEAAVLTGSRRYGPLAARPLRVPPPLAVPVVRWNTELGTAVTTVAWLHDHSAVLALTGAGQLVHLGGADGWPGWHEAGGALCLSASPAAPVVATGHLDGMLRLRSAHSGKVVGQQRLGATWVEHVRWSPDGRWLAAAAGPLLYVLDEVGRPLGCWEHPGTAIEGLSWRADSGAVATASSSGARLVVVPVAGAPAPTLSAPIGTAPGLTAVACSPTGRHLAGRQSNGDLWSWQLTTGAEQKVAACSAKVLSWQPDGARVAAACGRDLALWSVAAVGVQGPSQRLVYHRRASKSVGQFDYSFKCR